MANQKWFLGWIWPMGSHFRRPNIHTMTKWSKENWGTEYQNFNESRTVASLIVPGGQAFHFPHFFQISINFFLLFLNFFSFSSSFWPSGWAIHPAGKAMATPLNESKAILHFAICIFFIVLHIFTVKTNPLKIRCAFESFSQPAVKLSCLYGTDILKMQMSQHNLIKLNIFGKHVARPISA